MIRKTKIKTGLISYLLAIVLLLGACQRGEIPTENYPTITICTVHSLSVEVNQRISEAVSKITREKAGCNVQIIGHKLDTYDEELTVLYQSGAMPDAFAAFELVSYEKWISNGGIIEMEELLAPYKSELDVYISKKEWKIASLEDTIYGIPSCTSESKCMGFAFRRDICEELGIDWRSVDSLEKLHEMLLIVKEHYPEMDIIVPHSGRIIPRLAQDQLCNNIGVLVDKSTSNTTVENLYDSEYFKQLCVFMRQWNEEGLFMERAYRGTESRQDYLATGKGFGGFLNLSEISLPNLTRYVDYPLAAVQLAPRIADSDNCNMVWCISKDSKNPELTMNVLSLMYTDKDISQLLVYGEEGIEYEQDGEGFIKWYDNPDYQLSERWDSKVWSWPVGVTIDKRKEEEALIEYVEFWDEPVKDSPALGFLFDSSNVGIEVDACQSVIDKYESPLLCGELWPVTGLAAFQRELKAAGIDRVIKEKQKQLDHYLEIEYE